MGLGRQQTKGLLSCPSRRYSHVIRYFGKDKKKALEKYLAQATYLHGAQSLTQKISNGKMTLKQLCDLYLQYQNLRVLVGDITAKHYNDLTYGLRQYRR